MTYHYDRRDLLKQAGGILLSNVLARTEVTATTEPAPPARESAGRIVGHPEAAHVGAEVLAAGGNAVDAAVAAALVAGVVAVHQCGIGGYGGHLVLALPDGSKVAAIDFNSAAPAAARADMFPLDKDGGVKGRINQTGWLAAGVPGTLAGLQLALDHYGTQPFRKLAQPAIRLARDGFPVSKNLAAAIRAAQPRLAKDPASARLLLKNDAPLSAGSTFRNPELADLLQSLAERNSVDAFYRGAIARLIAAAFHKHGGLVTEADLAAYRAREVEPLPFRWRGYTVHTAPLTAGGLTVQEGLAILQALEWEKHPAKDAWATRARVEALRIAWDDRLRLLGDPDKVEVPVERLLSAAHARKMADRVGAALREGKMVPATTDGRSADGTIHLSSVDGHGMMVALTLTHGSHFGAQVAVDGLGLILGHGMSRFDPRPGRPNSPGPGKRPLHNMCPTVVLKDGKPMCALGGHGGRKIPNAVFDVLTRYVGQGAALADAIAAPRLHTEGGTSVVVEPSWPDAEIEHLRAAGYTVTRGPAAGVNAVARDSRSGQFGAASR
jgi:gamma-glutamyltranspeptidase/glutathione hydrolase